MQTQPKIDGRSKAARAAKVAAQQPEPFRQSIDEPEAITRAGVAPQRTARQPVRQPQARHVDREPVRRGAMVVTGRDGEVLARRQTSVGDVFHVPEHEIPEGWSYQWNTFTVHGQQATDQQVLMHANGWRPVPAERHPGRWTAHDHKGAIVVKGMRLEERPDSLTDEAKAEDIGKARTQMRDQTDSLRLTEKMPEGFQYGKGRSRHTGAQVRMTIDKGLDIPMPTHEFEE